MSGVIIHHYGNGHEAIGAVVVAQHNGMLHIINEDLTPHEALPAPKRAIQKDDKVIGGYLYDRIVAIAPTQTLFEQVTKHTEKKWLHPDHLALFMAKEGEAVLTKALVKDFAKTYHIGLLLIVTNNALILYDPISESIINEKPFETKISGKKGFYHRLGKLTGGLFNSNKVTLYETMIGELLK